MSDNVVIQESALPPVCRQEVEIVERKGKGHPDTICDAVSERISIALSRAYSKAAGRVLHHNIDKGLLVAGQVDCRLGGGRVLEPMRLIIGDRATARIGRRNLPVAQIALGAARDWFKQNLQHVDPDEHVRYQIELKPTSAELGAIFEPHRGLLVANDTSAAAGYAPLSPVERLVIGIEQFLNGPAFKTEFSGTGEDVKVMAVRKGAELSVTIAMPLLAHATPKVETYFRQKGGIVRAIQSFIRCQPHGCKGATVVLNALDRRDKGLDGIYLTLLGTSAEQADSGQVGRGNRASGVISLNRPASGEAVAGKNPVSHVGKIYNVLARELATRIHQQVPGVQEATVRICSTIGQCIDRPSIAAAEVSLARGCSLAQAKKPIRNIIQNGLKGMGDFCESLAKGRYEVF